MYCLLTMMTVPQFYGRMRLWTGNCVYQRLVSRSYSFLLREKLYGQPVVSVNKFSTLHKSNLSLSGNSHFQVKHALPISTINKYSTQSAERDKGSLIYTGRVGSMFKMLKIFSLTTSAIGLSLQPYLFVTYQDAPLVTAVPFFAALNIFVFVNPFLIHYIGKKYVMEMYFEEKTKQFTAVLMTFFARKYSFSFTADDVQVPDVPGLFSILTIKGRPLFVLDSDFTDMEVYKHMMGFDKPLDLTFFKEDRKDKN